MRQASAPARAGMTMQKIWRVFKRALIEEARRGGVVYSPPSAKAEPAPPTFARVKVEIVGDSPLIVHRMDWSYRMYRAGKPRTPKAEFDAARYRFKKGGRLVDGFPSTGIKVAMAVAGYRYLGLKSKVNTLGALFIEGAGPDKNLTEINFKGKKPVMRTDTVRLLSSNIVDHRYRPSYPKWSMQLVIRYISNFIQPEAIRELLNVAGRAVGLGEWRPEHKGKFGKFHVKTMVQLRERKAHRKAG